METHYVYITPLEGELYKDYIQRILDNRPNQKLDGVYMERHHILPKSKGGSNNKENLVWLYPQEHYYAHKILYLENPMDKQMQFAWWRISCANKERLNAEQYNDARNTFIQNNSGENHPRYGTHWDEDTKQQISNSLKGKYVGNKAGFYGHKHTDEAKKKVGDANRGRIHSKETREKMSESNKRQWLGKRLPQESIDKMADTKSKGGPILCVEDNLIFPTIARAKKYYHNLGLDINTSLVHRVCRGESKSAYGYHWRYATESEIQEQQDRREQNGNETEKNMLS